MAVPVLAGRSADWGCSHRAELDATAGVDAGFKVPECCAGVRGGSTAIDKTGVMRAAGAATWLCDEPKPQSEGYSRLAF